MIINLYTFYFPTSKLFSELLNFFFPKDFLLDIVESKLKFLYEDFDAILVSSGRSALYDFFSCVKNSKQFAGKNEVLIPNYICNVVDKAIIKSGLIPIKYETDEYFRPIIKDLHAKLSAKTFGVILAPIFGSFDETFVQATNLVKNSSNAAIIIDNAQCISCKPPANTDAVILSFNDKDIWGVMGGALLIKRGTCNLKFQPEKLSLLEEFRYLLEFLKKVFKILRKESSSLIWKLNRWHFEHSSCSRFPYTLNKKAISKISLIFALHGLDELESYKIKREKNYETFKRWCKSFTAVKIIETKHVSSSPFIPLKVIGDFKEAIRTFSKFRVQIKMPYAVEGKPCLSIKENVIAIPNNPKFDYSKIFRVGDTKA